MRRWLFVTAASESIGFGHVSRTRLLAREAHRLGIGVDVVASPGSAPRSSTDSGPRWHERDIPPHLIHDAIAGDPHVSVVVMDAPDDWLQRFSRHPQWVGAGNPPLVVAFRSDGPASDEDTFEHVSLTPSFESPRTDNDYGPARPVCRWRGRDLIFVRPSLFLEDPTAKADPPRIVVTMGGADPLGITSKVCQALLDRPVPAPVSIVLGRLNPESDVLESTYGERFEILRQGTFDFDELLKRASIAVVNAGLTRYECIAAQTPFIAISMQERQASFTELVVGEGFGVHAGVLGPSALNTTVDTLHAWLQRPATLDAMRHVGRRMLDPMNARHLVQRLDAWERHGAGEFCMPGPSSARNGDHP